VTRTEKTAEVVAERAERQGLPPQEVERTMAANILLGRLVEAREVAQVIAFLCSPRAVAINGDAVVVGGGVRGSIYY
jgi:NAD(P)-dependent dehydrogenase (short-subunit alcohol dehydrogenase family)